MAGDLQFSVEQKDLQLVSRALRREADSKQLRKDLLSDIKGLLAPLRDEVRSAVLSMESGGLAHEGQSLRQAVADKVTIAVRTGGRATGAGLKSGRKGMPRGFEHAPRRLNATKFRHPVFRRVTKAGTEVDVWVTQIGKPRWFDDTIRRHRGEYVHSIHAVIEAMARRIAARR